jgi:acetyl-CoA synthetase
MVRGRRPNVAWNCIDRHLDKRGDQTAIIWEGDDPRSPDITYASCTTKSQDDQHRTRNVKRGDRVTIYLPMIPEAACDVGVRADRCDPFSGIRRFLAGQPRPAHRDCQSKIVITADEGLRGGRKVPLKANVDAASKEPRRRLGGRGQAHRRLST